MNEDSMKKNLDNTKLGQMIWQIKDFQKDFQIYSESTDEYRERWGDSSRPDFLLISPNGHRIVLEFVDKIDINHLFKDINYLLNDKFFKEQSYRRLVVVGNEVDFKEIAKLKQVLFDEFSIKFRFQALIEIVSVKFINDIWGSVGLATLLDTVKINIAGAVGNCLIANASKEFKDVITTTEIARYFGAANNTVLNWIGDLANIVKGDDGVRMFNKQVVLDRLKEIYSEVGDYSVVRYEAQLHMSITDISRTNRFGKNTDTVRKNLSQKGLEPIGIASKPNVGPTLVWSRSEIEES